MPTVSRRHVFKNRQQILENPIPFHHDNFKRLGDIFLVKVGFNKKIIFTKHPDFIQRILQKDHRKYAKSSLQTKDLAKYIGQGLLTSNGDHWRKHRRMVQPAFHKQKLEGLLSIMQRAVQAELGRIRPDSVQDIYPLMGDLAFQVVAKSLFSRDDIQPQMAELKFITDANQRMLIREMRQPYLNWWYSLSGQIKKHKKLALRAREILNAIIDERLASDTEKDDLLDMLLNAKYEDGSRMSRAQLLDEVLILFAAGYETTNNALSFTLHLLANHPEAQEKAFGEVVRAYHGKRVDITVLRGLPYIKQCLEEAMRLYPPAYYIDRKALVAHEVEGFYVPKDAMLLLAVYELHRDGRFVDPDNFVPERFSEANKKERSGTTIPSVRVPECA